MIYQEKKVLCLNKKTTHLMNYKVYGNSEEKIICVHGLTRNSSDFHELAQKLSKNYQVICPDIAGRGNSDYIDEDSYNYEQYMQDIFNLFAQESCKKVTWIGTSMGGILGMLIASLPNSPIKKLVLNDIGTKISKESLDRLSKYVGEDVTFFSMEEAKAYFGKILASFGPMSDESWDYLVKNSIKPGNSGFVPAYDKKIKNGFLKVTNDIDLSSIWKKVEAPTLILRGSDSDLLSKETLKEMVKKDHVQSYEIPECGHAPSLKQESQIELINEWLKTE